MKRLMMGNKTKSIIYISICLTITLLLMSGCSDKNQISVEKAEEMAVNQIGDYLIKTSNELDEINNINTMKPLTMIQTIVHAYGSEEITNNLYTKTKSYNNIIYVCVYIMPEYERMPLGVFESNSSKNSRIIIKIGDLDFKSKIENLRIKIKEDNFCLIPEEVEAIFEGESKILNEIEYEFDS